MYARNGVPSCTVTLLDTSRAEAVHTPGDYKPLTDDFRVELGSLTVSADRMQDEDLPPADQRIRCPCETPAGLEMCVPEGDHAVNVLPKGLGRLGNNRDLNGHAFVEVDKGTAELRVSTGSVNDRSSWRQWEMQVANRYLASSGGGTRGTEESRGEDDRRCIHWLRAA